MATPTRPIRVDPTLWNAFGEATAAIGSDRTKVLIGFMRRFVAAMDISRTADPITDGDAPHSGA